MKTLNNHRNGKSVRTWEDYYTASYVYKSSEKMQEIKRIADRIRDSTR